MKEYVDQLKKGFKGDYLEFCNYVYNVLDKKISTNPKDPKYNKCNLVFFNILPIIR